MCCPLEAEPLLQGGYWKISPIKKKSVCVVCAWVCPRLWQLQEAQMNLARSRVSSQWIYAVIILLWRIPLHLARGAGGVLEQSYVSHGDFLVSIWPIRFYATKRGA